MVRLRSLHQRDGNPSPQLRVQLSEWPKNIPNNEERNSVANYAITSQPQFVQPQASSKARDHDVDSVNEDENIVASSLVKNGVAFHSRGEYEKALKAFQAALKTQMLTLGEEDPSIAQTLANIGAVYLRQGRLFLAGEALEEALHLKETLKKNCEDEAQKSKISLADVLNNLGNIASLRGDLVLSLSYYRSALKETRSGNGPMRELANAMHNVGRISVLKAEWDTALSVLTQCLQVEKKLYGPSDIQLADTIELIGFVHFSTGDYDNAMISFSEALSLFQEDLGAINASVASSLINIGMVMEARGQLKEAWHSYVAAREVFRKVGVDSTHHGLKAASRSIINIEDQVKFKTRIRSEKDSKFIPIEKSEMMEDVNGELEESREEKNTMTFEV